MADIPPRYSGPGLVDLQLNGYGGFDFNSDPAKWVSDDFRRVAAALVERGVVAALPTIITDDTEVMLARALAYAHILDESPDLRQTFPGLHIEGPFVASDDGPRGAHPKAHCRVPGELPHFLADLLSASRGRVSIITLAPELEGAVDLIEKAVQLNICVAIGHTQAAPDVIDQAVRAGARMSTHLGNGSHQFLPRHANYIQSQLAHDSLAASFIADGHHIPFYALKNYIRAKGLDRSVLVTDAVAAADMGPGRYPFGHDEVVVRDDLHVSKPGESNLAGSALTLDRAVMHVVMHCGVPFEAAWEMASSHPARIVRLTSVPDVKVEINSDEFRFLSMGK